MTVPGKIGTAAGRIADLWQAHRDDDLPRPGRAGRPRARQPATGLLRHRHPRRRMERLRRTPRPAHRPRHAREAIRFVHDAKTDRDKGELSPPAAPGPSPSCSAAPRKWSRTNVQFRAIALHHLDCPWRPADVAQREGRILRQGNHNDECRSSATSPSAPSTVHVADSRTQSRFIAQVMRGRLDVREIEDIGDAALSYSEVKALATGNPLLMDKAEADAS